MSQPKPQEINISTSFLDKCIRKCTDKERWDFQIDQDEQHFIRDCPQSCVTKSINRYNFFGKTNKYDENILRECLDKSLNQACDRSIKRGNLAKWDDKYLQDNKKCLSKYIVSK